MENVNQLEKAGVLPTKTSKQFTLAFAGSALEADQ